MNWINFVDGSRYTFASDIQKFAEANGYEVHCDPDGTRHPGTDCNRKLRVIFKDAGMRRTFNLNDRSVINVEAEQSFANEFFLKWLVENGIVSNSYLKKRSIQLYTVEAVNALLSKMLQTQVEYEFDDSDRVWDCPTVVNAHGHNLEQSKNKPKVSLFKKNKGGN